MSDTTTKAAAAAAAAAKGSDAIWPFVLLYAVMWAGMIGTSLNTDAIKLDYSIAVVLGFAFALAIAIYLAAARLRRQAVFGFGHATIIGNLAWWRPAQSCPLRGADPGAELRRPGVPLVHRTGRGLVRRQLRQGLVSAPAGGEADLAPGGAAVNGCRNADACFLRRNMT